jgi:serine/threonine protein phosphatase PrpC
MKFTIYQESRIGQRSNNQDRLLYRYSPEALLMVVADGMGGHSHGEVAAQIATVRIAKCFEQYAQPRINDPAKFWSMPCSTRTSL